MACIMTGVGLCFLFFLFKQKTAYEMRISDWSSDVCSSDLIALEKLMVLMDSENITFDDLRNATMKARNVKVHVVGDMIVDTFTYCSMIGGMTKTPTMSVRFEEKQDFVGGAGIVAKHLRAAGAEVTLTTVLGDDELGRMAQDDLHSAGIIIDALIDPTRPTTNKNAIIVSDYRMLKDRKRKRLNS